MDLIERYRPALEEICSKHSLGLDYEVLTDRRDKYIQKGRAECYAFLRHQGFNYTTISKAFNKTHAAVMYGIKKHCAYKDKIRNVN